MTQVWLNAFSRFGFNPTVVRADRISALSEVRTADPSFGNWHIEAAVVGLETSVVLLGADQPQEGALAELQYQICAELERNQPGVFLSHGRIRDFLTINWTRDPR